MKKIKLFAGVAAVVCGGMLMASLALADNNNQNNQGNDNPRSVGSTLEVHINDNGQTLVRGAKVTSISGTTIDATTSWGALNINWVVNAANASVNRRFGGKGSISEISQGDFVSFSGPMDTTATAAFTVNANVVKDWSIQTKHDSFTGVVKSVNAAASSFVLTSKERGDVTVTASSSTMITKGSVAVPFSTIVAGANVFAQGIFNNSSNTVAATTVKILTNALLDQDSQKHMFEGTIVSLATVTPPTTLVLKIEDNTSVTVNLPVGSAVVGQNFQTLSLSAIQAGDHMSISGTLNANGSLDAVLIRDLSR